VKHRDRQYDAHHASALYVVVRQPRVPLSCTALQRGLRRGDCTGVSLLQ
jgi:hypothetical protein